MVVVNLLQRSQCSLVLTDLDISPRALYGVRQFGYCDSCSFVSIHNSRLIGGPVNGSIASINCFGISWGNAFYTDTCPSELGP